MAGKIFIMSYSLHYSFEENFLLTQNVTINKNEHTQYYNTTNKSVRFSSIYQL